MGTVELRPRHRFSADYVVELPFGPGRRWLHGGFWAGVLGGWMWSGTVTIASGPPFTARVLGAAADVAEGVNGTLRADVTGGARRPRRPDLRALVRHGRLRGPAAGHVRRRGAQHDHGAGHLSGEHGAHPERPSRGDAHLSLRVQATTCSTRPSPRHRHRGELPDVRPGDPVAPMRSVQLQAEVPLLSATGRERGGRA